jgi:hypothetical protein
MKKGNWQQDINKHKEVYGDWFMSIKEFNLKIEDDIKNHIKMIWQSLKGECDVYEFGVYTGGTLKDISSQLDFYSIPARKIWGFDSFEGLPIEEEGKMLEGKHWNEGAFSACDALNIWNWEELENVILEKINRKNVKLIKGFYSETLNKILIKENDFKPAMFVNIDVDLYISTIDVLTWLFENKLVTIGTVIRYDDVNFIPETEGELLAHKEMCEKYKVECERLNKHYFIIRSLE